jgi:mannose-1-phosphate guanylyltransferase
MSISYNQPKSLITNLSWSAPRSDGFHTDDKWAIILAGGDRLPRNSPIRASVRRQRPRHFCRTPGSDFVINQTRRQISHVFAPEKTMFVVSEDHLSYSEEVLADVARGNLIVEPQDDGTTFAILYSLLRLRQKNPNALVTFFPADFAVPDTKGFMAHVEAAQTAARHQPSLVLLGIEPSSPDENREWIVPDFSSPVGDNRKVWRVSNFRDSVSRAEAHELMNRGGLWNSSVMVGTIATFLRKIRRAAPEIYENFIAAESKLETPGEYLSMRRIYYGNFADTDFSRDVLAKSAEKLAVIPVPAEKRRGIGIKPLSGAQPNPAATTFKSLAATGSF